jgi:acyl-CoA synthetase (AMP-forming)/AMP-acid ligase II
MLAMPALSERIAAAEGDLLLAQDGRRLDHAALCGLGLSPAAMAEAGGAAARVALVISDPVLFMQALVALDGRVAGLMLLSYNLPDDQVAGLARAAGCNAILTNRAAALQGQAGFDGLTILDAAPALTGQAGPAGQQTQWLLTTSGTTGLPKIISHSLQGLALAVRQTRLRQPETVPVWGHVIDPARLAGLLVMLQGLIGGGRLVVADPAASLAEQVAALVAGGVTHLSGTPTLWRRILMIPEHRALALTQVTLGGEIADGATLRTLAGSYPGARISHIYASTETGQGFSVIDGRPGFPADWLQAAPGGLALQIREGILWLQPPPGARDLRRSGVEMDADGFIRTGDLVEHQGDRVLFLGRESGLINVAGIKVWPEVVEAVIKSVPGVGLVLVSARKSPVTGALVMAEVQAEAGVDQAGLKSAILAACRAELPREAVPAILRFVSDMSINAAGKIQRSGKT